MSPCSHIYAITSVSTTVVIEMMYKTVKNIISNVSYVPSLLPLALALSGVSVPLEKRMESSCRRGGGL